MAIELRGFDGINVDTLDVLLEESQQKLMPRISQAGVVYLPYQMVEPGKYQPRSNFDEEKLSELAESIKADGIIQPIIVRKISRAQKDVYEIIAGERRWRAAGRLGLKEVPVVIREISDETALAFGIIENIQRENLNPIEEAVAIERLHKEFSLTHDQIAAKVGRSRPVITSLLKLLSLPEEVKGYLKDNKIDMGHIKPLYVLTETELLLCVRRIVNEKLSVRKAEELAQKIKANEESSSENKDTFKDKYELQNVNVWKQKLAEKYSSSVTIKQNENGEGKVSFHVSSAEEMEWLLNRLIN